MDILGFFSLVIGGLMIAHCLVYLRMRPKIFSNLREMTLFGIISLLFTILVVIHSSWWTLAILIYTLVLIRMSACNSCGKLWDFGYLWFNTGNVRRLLMVTLSWVTLIFVSLISIKVATLYANLYVTIVYLPIIILTFLSVGYHLNKALNSFNWVL